MGFAGPETQHLRRRRTQDPRCPEAQPPQTLLRTWSPGLAVKLPEDRFWKREEPTLPLCPGVKISLSFLWACLPLCAPQLWVGTHIPSSSMGQVFFPNRGSGFVKGVCVQIPQETVLSDSFPRTTWGLHLQFPSWFCYEAPQFCRLVVSLSDSLRPHGLQHARLPSPSLSPGVCTYSCPLSQRCRPTISSSVIHFSPCLQSFPASGSFQMSQFFASGGQSIGASASVITMNIQD